MKKKKKKWFWGLGGSWRRLCTMALMFTRGRTSFWKKMFLSSENIQHTRKRGPPLFFLRLKGDQSRHPPPRSQIPSTSRCRRFPLSEYFFLMGNGPSRISLKTKSTFWKKKKMVFHWWNLDAAIQRCAEAWKRYRLMDYTGRSYIYLYTKEESDRATERKLICLHFVKSFSSKRPSLLLGDAAEGSVAKCSSCLPTSSPPHFSPKYQPTIECLRRRKQRPCFRKRTEIGRDH